MARPPKAADRHVSFQSFGDLHTHHQRALSVVGQKPDQVVREWQTHRRHRATSHSLRPGHRVRYVCPVSHYFFFIFMPLNAVTK